MQLLKIQEQKRKDDMEKRLQVLRTQEIGEELEHKTGELNLLNETFEKNLNEQRSTFEREQLAFTLRRDALKFEVDDLERRRKLALLPLEEREKSLEDERQKLRRAKELLDTKDEDFEMNTELLKERIDAVSEREFQVTKGENSLDLRRKGVEAQATSITHQSRVLSDRIQVFALEISSEKRNIFSEKQKLEALKTYVDNERIRQQSREIQFINEKRALLDAYKTLERTVKRYQKQYGSRFTLT